jgi:hypothetical protein
MPLAAGTTVAELGLRPSCSSGKRTYASRVAAQRAARALQGKGLSGSLYYRCTECRLWHLTKNDWGTSRR